MARGRRMQRVGSTIVCVILAAAAIAAAAAQPTATTNSGTPIPVVGVKTGIDANSGQRPARQNINSLWARGGPQWDLYILALSELQAVDETDELSYFALAGIHGLPHSAWNGVEQVDGAPSSRGYCPHGEVLFSTWHRPYVALFEQTLVSHAARIAQKYPVKVAPTYKAAAQTLRQPYWDWASDPELPPAATGVNVTVNGPNGVVTLRNPLYSYRFQRVDVEATFGGSLAAFPETWRCRASGEALANNSTASNEGLAHVAGDLMSDVYDVFTRTTTFDAMAYDEWRGSSFENPHNIVHSASSCSGTMSSIDWSAFDPLFMLHHCNIDRLVAMWQAINYKTPMFTTTANSTGQFGTPPGTAITADSPLKPFFDENLVLHTSNSVAAISKFGYTYPEIDDWSTTPEELATSLRAQVNGLYSHNQRIVDLATSSSFQQPRPPHRDDQPGGGDQTQTSYYTAEIQVNRSEISLPATVNLVIDGLVVGRMAILGMPCEGFASVSLPLRDTLLQGNLSLQNMAPQTVIPFLQQNLTMEIRASDGTPIPVSSTPSLQLEVQELDFMPRVNGSTFPVFGNATRWPIAIRQSDNCEG
ncbi:hypothetical protein B0H63DRAFT_207757 [Podospora didyma]|uniref:Tyrosinase copper-binding domain-containing protein n=1 Tax=Podospora didyma TaxID=330526 RepID=A0AAE0TW34_9PEZI|nr:hypothetical protein B0H63DRAFT_207757 [Podospora didyma]